MSCHFSSRFALAALVVIPALAACGGSTSAAKSAQTPATSSGSSSSSAPSSTSSSSSAPVHVSMKILRLRAGDTFTTGQEGVLCQAGTRGLLCGFAKASPYGVMASAAKKLCDETALQSIILTGSSWWWGCGTGVPVVPSASSNAWAAADHLPIDKRLNAPILADNSELIAAGIPCRVSAAGALDCSTPMAATTGFTADRSFVRPRGINAVSKS